MERPVTTSPAEGVGLGVSFTTVSQELSVAIPTVERAHGYSQGGSTLLTVGSDQVKVKTFRQLIFFATSAKD